MPPRHTYWTIIVDDQPTAFRAHDPEELLPTLNRLREKNQTAVMKWFERGQLFDSRDQARDAGLGQGERRWEGPRPERDSSMEGRGAGRQRDGADKRLSEPHARPAGPGPGRGDRARDKNWRPGGEHRDPRQKYKDAKKAKWNRFKDKIRERHDERGARNAESFTPPHGDKLRDAGEGPADAPPRDKPGRRPGWQDDRGDRGERGDRADRGDRAEGARDRKPREAWRPGPAAKPHGDKFGRSARPEWRRDDDRRGSGPASGDRERRPWSDRPPRRDGDRDQRGWSDRPPRRDDDRPRGPAGDRRPSGDRPPRRDGDRDARPWSDRPPRRDNDRPRGPATDRRPSGDRPPRRDDDRPDRGSYRSREDSGGWKPKGPDWRKPAGGSDRKPWGAKPSGAARKPWGSKPAGRGPAGGRPPKRRRDDE